MQARHDAQQGGAQFERFRNVGAGTEQTHGRAERNNACDDGERPAEATEHQTTLVCVHGHEPFARHRATIADVDQTVSATLSPKVIHARE